MMITLTEELKKVCERAARFSFITLDTEFIREKTYYPELCLIQMATPEEEVCIDPLAAGLDLKPLFDLLQNQKVVKVFHAARQDVEIFYHLTGCIPTPLFDTQVAAMVCGYGENVGYQQLVQDLADVSLDKSMRVTDWSRRPLNQEQVKYALRDVTYLRDVYQNLSEQLEKNGRKAWLAEEIAVQNNPETYNVNEDECWRRIKIPFKKPVQVHVFSKVCAWREKTAKNKNRPRKYILKDEVLIELAAVMPDKKQELSRCRGLTDGFVKTFGDELCAVIQQAKKDSPDLYPKNWMMPKPLTPAQHTLAELLHLLLLVVSSEVKVAPKIIATTDEIHQLARGNDSVPCMQGWRREIFGDKVGLFKKGVLSFGYNPKTHQVEVKEDV